MTRCSITFTLIATVLLVARVDAAESKPTEFKVHPIGHVKKSEDGTRIVLDKKYQPGLLGLEGFTHINIQHLRLRRFFGAGSMYRQSLN